MRISFWMNGNKMDKEKLIQLFWQIIKFGIVGTIAFFVDFWIFVFLTDVVGIHYLISSTLSFTVSVTVNYLCSMAFVFQRKEGMSRQREFIIFVVLGLMGLGVNQIAMWIFVEKFFISTKISKVLATFFVMVWNFVTRKIFLEKRG